jgi:hypothetical protein
MSVSRSRRRTRRSRPQSGIQLEHLEQRRLLAYTPPSDYVLLDTLTVPTTGASTESFIIPANTTYHFVASGTGTIATNPTRSLDAEYIQRGELLAWEDSKAEVDWESAYPRGAQPRRAFTGHRR